MGVWEEYCLICGGPLTNKFILIKYTEEEDIQTTITKKEYNWMNQLFLLTSDNQIIKTMGNKYDSYGGFKLGPKSYAVSPHRYVESDNYGVVCHQDCYHLIQKKLKHDMLFVNVCRLLDKYNSILKPKSKYKPMDKFIQQFYEYNLIIKNHEWLLESPLVNKQNEQRILKIWTLLVDRFKKNPPRNSPCESATDYNGGVIRKGFDGNDYIVKAYNGVKKWILYDPDQDEKIVVKAKSKIRKSRKGSNRTNRKKTSRKRSSKKK